MSLNSGQQRMANASRTVLLRHFDERLEKCLEPPPLLVGDVERTDRIRHRRARFGTVGEDLPRPLHHFEHGQLLGGDAEGVEQLKFIVVARVESGNPSADRTDAQIAQPLDRGDDAQLAADRLEPPPVLRRRRRCREDASSRAREHCSWCRRSCSSGCGRHPTAVPVQTRRSPARRAASRRRAPPRRARSSGSGRSPRRPALFRTFDRGVRLLLGDDDPAPPRRFRRRASKTSRSPRRGESPVSPLTQLPLTSGRYPTFNCSMVTLFLCRSAPVRHARRDRF